MKYLLTLVLLISIVVNGLTSYHLFRASSYDLSSLLIIASYLSIVLGIYVVTMRKRKPTFIE
jgi:ABC-type spermidine/putrescine transport system permease subunit II